MVWSFDRRPRGFQRLSEHWLLKENCVKQFLSFYGTMIKKKPLVATTRPQVFFSYRSFG